MAEAAAQLQKGLDQLELLKDNCERQRQELELRSALGAVLMAAKGIEAKDIPADSLAKTTSIANAYWFAHQQSRDGWTHELDLRPSVETW